jgi:hypothetical protein
LPELVVEGRERHLVIRDLVAEGQAQLRDIELQYAFIGKGGREVLRGRPVAFALWSEAQKNWTIADLEIPSPPVKWKPGHGPLPFTVRTPGIEVRHVKGTGAERLMFAFSRGGEELKKRMLDCILVDEAQFLTRDHVLQLQPRDRARDDTHTQHNQRTSVARHAPNRLTPEPTQLRRDRKRCEPTQRAQLPRPLTRRQRHQQHTDREAHHRQIQRRLPTTRRPTHEQHHRHHRKHHTRPAHYRAAFRAPAH